MVLHGVLAKGRQKNYRKIQNDMEDFLGEAYHHSLNCKWEKNAFPLLSYQENQHYWKTFKTWSIQIHFGSKT